MNKQTELDRTKQIMFVDLENKTTHGGILLTNGNVVCGCCGCIFEADEEGVTWETLHVFDTWVGLDDEICGDALIEKKGEGA